MAKPEPKMPSLSERFRAYVRSLDPEGHDAVVRASAAAATRMVDGQSLITDIDTFKLLLSEEFDKVIKMTDEMVPGLTIADMRRKKHATTIRLVASPEKRELTTAAFTESSVRSMARLMINGRDGVMGTVSQIAQKYPGVWRLASYELEDAFASVTVTQNVAQPDGSIAETRFDQPSGELLKIFMEFIETTGAPEPRYENGRPVGSAPQATSSPELAAAMTSLAEAMTTMKNGQQPHTA